MKYLNLSLILTAVLAAASQPALADSSASANTSTSSSSSNFLDVIKQNAKASYLLEMTGPTLGAPSGNTDGSGKNLQIAHYPSIGSKLGGKWSFNITQPLIQTLDDVPEGQKGATPAFQAGNPYISFSNSRIMGSSFQSFSLFGQLRYYTPFSRATHDAVNDGKAADVGNGRFRLLLDPSLAFMDGALTVEAPTYFFALLAKNSDAERIAKSGSATRNDYNFLPSIVTSYQLTKNVQPYIETGIYFHHTTDQKWSKTDDKKYGLYISEGTNINIGKKFTLTPIVQFGPFWFNPKRAQITIDANYVFL